MFKLMGKNIVTILPYVQNVLNWTYVILSEPIASVGKMAYFENKWIMNLAC